MIFFFLIPKPFFYQNEHNTSAPLGIGRNQKLVFNTYLTRSIHQLFQVWRHRQIMVEWLGEPGEELELTALILSQDAKNYHAWQHRQWVISTYSLFSKELEFVEGLISNDVRNNSAWTQRYFVINRTSQFTPDIIEREIKFCKEKILAAPKNESAWNYLRG